MIDTELSKEYAKTAADSCLSVGIEPQYFCGYHNMSSYQAFSQTGVKLPNLVDDPKKSRIAPWGCATAGHVAIWKKIADGDDNTVIVLEHDALMLHPLTIEIPDGVMAVLGYKLHDPKRYNHVRAGAPKRLVNINTHQGAHAYAITKKTAQMLIDELESGVSPGNIDDRYFIRKGNSKPPAALKLVDPTPAIGWARKTTVWNRDHARAPNAAFIQSFKENLK